VALRAHDKCLVTDHVKCLTITTVIIVENTNNIATAQFEIKLNFYRCVYKDCVHFIRTLRHAIEMHYIDSVFV